jgi:hypothetical protein
MEDFVMAENNRRSHFMQGRGLRCWDGGDEYIYSSFHSAFGGNFWQHRYFCTIGMVVSKESCNVCGNRNCCNS